MFGGKRKGYFSEQKINMNETQKLYFASLYETSGDLRAIIAPNTGLSQSDLQIAIAAAQEQKPSLENLNSFASVAPKMRDYERTQSFFDAFDVDDEAALQTAMENIIRG